MKRVREKFKSIDFGPKNDPVTPFCTTCHQEQFQKHLMNMFEEKFNKSMVTPIFDHAQLKIFVSHFIFSEFVLETLMNGSEENRSQTDGRAY